MRHCERLACGMALASLGVVAGGRQLVGQQVHGTVRDSTSRLAIAGAVVTTLDSSGRALQRSVSDEHGQYRIAAPAAARRLRIVRLGFRPVETRLVESRADLTEIDVVMARIPYNLQQVRITAAASCPRRSDARAALALLEQARAGLLATIVARSEKPAHMVRLAIERMMDGANDSIVRHQVRRDSAASTPASFAAARTATDFVRRGFTVDSAGSRFYFGPDAEVLLDDGFASGYCFRIMGADRSRPHQVGLGFRAADRRRGRVDIDGALWIDTVARALVDIDFRYVGLDRQMDPFRPGGYISFREMANGVVLIDRWFLRGVGARTDSVEENGVRVAATARSGSTTAQPAQVLYAGETGGELARATWSDGYTWRAPLGTLRLNIVTDRGDPGAGTVVRLDDTDYEATADSTGHLEITELAPGPYSALIADTRLDPIGVTLATSLTFVAARDSTVEQRLAAKTAEKYVSDRCWEDLQDPRDGVWVIGRVTGPDGAPVDRVRWSAVSNGKVVKNAETGTDGIFVFCKGTRGAPVAFEFKRKGMASGMTNRTMVDELTVIAVEMSPAP